MMMTPELLKSEYLSLLDSWCSVVAEGDALRVTFPYLDIHRDMIEVFVVPGDSGMVITDYGMMLGGLETDGVSIAEDTRKYQRLTELMAWSGFTVSRGCLRAEASEEDMADKLHTFAQIALFVQGMVLGVHRGAAEISPAVVSRRLLDYSIEAKVGDLIVDRYGIRHHFSLTWEREGHHVLARTVTRFEAEQAERFAYSLLSLRPMTGTEYRGVVFVPPGGVPSEGSKASKIAASVSLRTIPLDRIAEAQTI